MAESSSSTHPSDNNDNDILSLQSAMKAADSIRKALRESGVEDSFPPPGSLPGVAAFVGTGLLLTPLRSMMLKAAAPKVPSTPPSARAGDMNSHVTQQQGMASFVNLVDLMVTPFLAVISAQVGLVVGTLYGSSYFLERVVTVKDENKERSSDAACKALLSAVTNTADTSVQGMQSDTTSSQDGVLQTASASAAPQMYESWDPRQQTIDRLYHAIRHCQEQERRSVENDRFGL